MSEQRREERPVEEVETQDAADSIGYLASVVMRVSTIFMHKIKTAVDAVLPVRIRRRLSVAWEVFSATRSISLTLLSQQALDVSAGAFEGWFTSHRTRWWEYAWIRYEASQRAARVKPVAADLGAGKSPVPLMLTNLGFHCTVVDRAQLQELQEPSRGNEWDFVDYGRWGIRTIRAGMEESIFPTASLGLVVSVSVIEHLPAEVRRLALKQIARSLEPAGYAIMTLDLLPNSRNLWNRVVDEIESVEEHGTLNDFLAEAAAVGLAVEHLEACPIKIPKLHAVGLVLQKQI